MDIHIRCSKCGKHLAVDEKTVGMIINCPDCSTALRVPLNHEKQICPHCRGETLVANNMNGQSIECSSCHKTFSVKSLNDPKHHACPFCYTAILVPDDFKGQFIDCPTCNQRYMIHRPNQDFQYRQNPSEGSTNGEQAEESPKGHYAKGIPQGLTANSLNRFRIVMLILAVILPIMAIGIYSVLPQSNHVVTIIAGAWILSLSFINRKIRIVFPSIGLMWGVYRTDKGFTSYDITIIVISVLIGIWSYRLPVIGSGGLKISLKDEEWENEERKRQRRIEAERRAMQSNGRPLLWSLIIIIALLLVFPGSRHWVVSAFKFDSPQTAKMTASSGPTDGWVGGVPKASQTKQQAIQGSHKTGKYAGLDGQDPLSTITINNGTVYYSKPITEGEASALARFLVLGLFDGEEKQIVLSYSDEYYILGKRASVAETNIDGFRKAYAQHAREISNQVFQGKPVKFCFFDKDFNILMELSDSDGQKEFKEYQKSLAYQRGFEHGKRMGKQDREMASYNHLWPDSPDNSIFGQVAHLAGCDPGTPEYADFAEGYDLGYRAAR